MRANQKFSSSGHLVEPEINYLAKDYASFRRLVLDRLALIMPDWQERIDHCFYRNLGTSVFQSGEMLLDDYLDIEINDGAETIHYLSDHNAVRMSP